MRLLLASLLIGAVASTPLAVTSGCGGCGVDEITATASTSCLKTSAERGWGCDTTAVLEGDNDCPVAVTLAKAGTALTADLVIPPGDSWSIDVLRSPTGEIQKSFAFSIAGQPGTIEVAW